MIVERSEVRAGRGEECADGERERKREREREGGREGGRERERGRGVARDDRGEV